MTNLFPKAMRNLKNVLAGIAAAIVAIVLWLALWLGASIWLSRRFPMYRGMALVVNLYDLILPTIVGFSVGFWVSRRRQRRAVGNQ
jgi:hypothetical protein